ncbi:hypothetical protein L798_13584 [Zootermopsis nevadensis]|uniref:Uncharacterized protein n=1 Tax=Zootermopsis nevadensis TaxID=136037 RepID=A0A067QRD4_ZOONE|nr:hypothetical protein L798_13584 [Zootermopsis nevadensis]
MSGNMVDVRVPRWWMGGVASAAAACFTQFLDTIKVNCAVMETVSSFETLVNFY